MKRTIILTFLFFCAAAAFGYGTYALITQTGADVRMSTYLDSETDWTGTYTLTQNMDGEQIVQAVALDEQSDLSKHMIDEYAQSMKNAIDTQAEVAGVGYATVASVAWASTFRDILAIMAVTIIAIFWIKSKGAKHEG